MNRHGLSLLVRKNSDLLPKIIVNQVTVKADFDGTEKGSDVKKNKINLTTLFNDMDTVACTERSSVLSARRSRVRLLIFLGQCKRWSAQCQQSLLGAEKTRGGVHGKETARLRD